MSAFLDYSEMLNAQWEIERERQKAQHREAVERRRWRCAAPMGGMNRTERRRLSKAKARRWMCV